MEELELTYNDLKKINPELIMASITPFGQTGRYHDYRACQLNTYHAGGEGFLLPMMSPDLSREPVRGGSLVGDCICGLSASTAIVAASYRAKATGLGQYIDISKQDIMTTMVLLDIAMYANLEIVRNRLRRPLLMPLPMKCRDGYLMMSALTDREWKSVVEFMGNPAWADDERFGQWLSRHISGDDINPHMEELVQQYNKDDLFHRLQANAIAAVPVNTAEDLMNSPQLEQRGFFRDVEHPKAGSLKYPTAGYKLSRTPWNADNAAPLLGQHNELVYCGRLGYHRQELGKMRETGVI
jgi:crotonobetainyl-CoA:carnitine CoA-transferase CaiB-like acyl-CoA transferase